MSVRRPISGGVTVGAGASPRSLAKWQVESMARLAESARNRSGSAQEYTVAVIPTYPATAMSPSAILDAGGDSNGRLTEQLYRCADEIVSGQVLEVVSQSADSSVIVSAWCAHTGNRLLRTLVDDRTTVFWIERQ